MNTEREESKSEFFIAHSFVRLLPIEYFEPRLILNGLLKKIIEAATVNTVSQFLRIQRHRVRIQSLEYVEFDLRMRFIGYGHESKRMCFEFPLDLRI